MLGAFQRAMLRPYQFRMQPQRFVEKLVRAFVISRSQQRPSDSGVDGRSLRVGSQRAKQCFTRLFPSAQMDLCLRELHRQADVPGRQPERCFNWLEALFPLMTLL